MPSTPDRLAPPPINQRTGLGDVVHAAAQPIVMLVNVLGGPNLNHCGGCAARQAKLNAAVPDIRHPLSRK